MAATTPPATATREAAPPDWRAGAAVGPRRRRPASAARTATYAVLLLGACASLLPFVYMGMTALKSYGSVVNNSFWPWPPFGAESLQFQNYPQAIQTIGFDRQWGIPLFVRYLANSLIVVSATVAGTLATSIGAAYALARLRVPGENVLFLLALAVVMVPEDVTLVPRVVLMYDLHWYNTYWALVMPFTVNVFSIFLLRQFFRQLPRELFEAAVMDGMGHLRYLASVALPLSKPAVATVALLSFIWAWDSFKWPLLVTRDASMRVLAVGLQQFKSGEGTYVQLLMAFATLVVLPVLVLYLLVQKQFREAITTVGIKG